MKLRVDEALNIYGDKTKVKLCKWYSERNYIIDNYYLFYDKQGVYHIENSKSKKIVYTFRCIAWSKAMDVAKKFIQKDWC
jgi:hypothetical protein